MLTSFVTSRSRHRGFSLVELMVVIAIIGLLAAFLFAMFHQAKERARQTECASNLRRLYTAFAMYASDNDSRVPPYTTKYGGEYHMADGTLIGRVPDGAQALVRVLHPYTRSDAIWFCPSDTLAYTFSQQGRVNHRYTSYGTTSMLDYPAFPELHHPIRISPSVTRHDGTTYNASQLMLMSDNLFDCLPESNITPPYSHNGLFNRVYFDGHVRSFRRENNCEWPDK